MPDQPIFAAFAAAIADPRFAYALGISVVAGLVRGFTGFGSALIYMPLMSALYDPKLAAATLLLIDSICSLPFTIRAIPHCNWCEVVPVSIAGAIFVPFGVMALVFVDPLSLRWFICALVFIALTALVAGWRYRGKPTLAGSFTTGAFSGFGGGSVQIGAPPLLVFWLGGDNKAATVRANIMVYFLVQGALSVILYFYNGLFDERVLVLSVLTGLPFALALTAGAYYFHGSSDALYRRVAYVIIAFAGLASLPLFDGLR
jgi:uncharacterized membrane protein YfcA